MAKSRSSLPPGIQIKADLSKEERVTKGCLLKERRALIETGVQRNRISFRRNKLFIDDRLHGEVDMVNFSFQKGPLISDFVASALESIKTSSYSDETQALAQSNSTATSTNVNSCLHGDAIDGSNSQTPYPSDVTSQLTPPTPSSVSQPVTQASTTTTNTPNWLPVCLWNSRSLVNKLRDFQSFVYSSPFNVIAITETWLSSTILSKEILPTEFVIYRKDRQSRGGGVLLAVHNKLLSSEIPSPPDLEVLTIKIKTFRTFYLCVTYISPSANSKYHMDLLAYLDSICADNQVIILGDFNCPDICWSTLTGFSSFSRDLCNLAFKHNLAQFVDFPTHSSGSTLDLIFSSPGIPIRDLNKFNHYSLCSDHSPISFFVPELHQQYWHSSSSDSVSSTISIYQYKKANFEEMSSLIMDYDLTHFYSSTDIEFLWNTLKDLIIYAISLHTPTVRAKYRHHPQWFTSSIRHKLNKIHSLRKKCKQHPTHHKKAV